MRQLALATALLFVVGMAACSSSSSSSDTPQTADCCKKTADVKAQIPQCCAKGDGDCCKASKADPSKMSDCCKKAADLSAKMPECCKKQQAGEPQACCSKK